MNTDKLLNFFRNVLHKEGDIKKEYTKLEASLTPEESELVNVIFRLVSAAEDAAGEKTLEAACLIAKEKGNLDDDMINKIAKTYVALSISPLLLSAFVRSVGGSFDLIAKLVTRMFSFRINGFHEEITDFDDKSLEELNQELDEQLKKYEDD